MLYLSVCLYLCLSVCSAEGATKFQDNGLQSIARCTSTQDRLRSRPTNDSRHGSFLLIILLAQWFHSFSNRDRSRSIQVKCSAFLIKSALLWLVWQKMWLSHGHAHLCCRVPA